MNNLFGLNLGIYTACKAVNGDTAKVEVISINDTNAILRFIELEYQPYLHLTQNCDIIVIDKLIIFRN